MATAATAAPSAASVSAEEKEEALRLFEELLRFETVSFEGPASGAYRACAEWLVQTLSGLGLETQVWHCVCTGGERDQGWLDRAREPCKNILPFYHPTLTPTTQPKP